MTQAEKAALSTRRGPLGLTDQNLTVARRWLMGLLFLGLCLRLVRWALAMPIWGDEAMIGLNIIQRDYAGLLRPLDHAQVSPVLFLWIERAVYEFFGMTERAMRLPPLLAGLAALLLFWRWSRLLVDSFAAASATGIMAVGFYVVRHGTELKPYAFDLLAALMLLLPATHLLLGHRRWWFIPLILLTPVVMLTSYPSVFVVGGIFLALALWAISQKKISLWLAVILFGLVILLSFSASLLMFSQGQYDHTARSMTAYWRDAFPPGNPLKFAVWFAKTHVGNLFAYPAGGKNGASAGSLILFVIGLLALRGKMPSAISAFPRRIWLTLFLAPFALTFIAAAMHRYPYGESARVSQHLAPIIILVMSMGISAAVQQLAKTEKGQLLAIRGILIAIAIIGVIGLVINLAQPYKTKDDQLARDLIRCPIWKLGTGKEPVIVLQKYDSLWPNYQWYLAEKGPQIKLYDAENQLPALQSILNEKLGLISVYDLRSDAKALPILKNMNVPIIAMTDAARLQIGPRQQPPEYFRAFYMSTPITETPPQSAPKVK